GPFYMGSDPTDRDREGDEGWRLVTLSQDFALGATEVTQAQYFNLMGINPVEERRRMWSNKRGPKQNEPCADFGLGLTFPVHCISWYEAIEFCNILSTLEGLTPAYEVAGQFVRWDQSANGYRLPTEAEWEFAARSGGRWEGTWQRTSDGQVSGEDPSELCNIANVGDQKTKRSHPRWSKRGIVRCDDLHADLAPVASRRPVAGLYDMTGNLWEWVWDGYVAGRPGQGQVVTPRPGEEVVLRGATWQGPPSDYRIGNRFRGYPDRHSFFVGFRLARSL
ncbi:MAG: formylglycine-generating enzyme family protein, partial [Myxococcota bacterium]|nr:formylglycine-generating enzyme family protein [Myxococcota bacterium]